MSKTQCYIGAPNGIVLCVQRKNQASQTGSGVFWHSYSTEPTEYTNSYELVLKMERFFDEIRFPFPTTTMRTFGEEHAAVRRSQEKKKVMADEMLLQKHGDLGTFIIRVQHRQNSSWQGRITWVEEDRTVNFRSIWEMIKLVESALDTVDEETIDTEISW